MKLTHLDENGAAHMVNIGAKPVTQREAVAQSVLTMQPETLRMILDGTAPKGGSHKTGIEMEALTAATVAALTVYDMCKAVDRGMRIDETLLLHKTGGKSGDYHAEGAAAR